MLRHQIKILKRRSSKRPQFSWLDRMLFVLSANRKLKSACLIFRPDTLYKWHKKLVKWKYTHFKEGTSPGRPLTKVSTEQLVLRLKSENRLWGVPRIHGELVKLGFKISRTTIRNILKRNGLYPEDTGQNYQTWSQFLRQHKKVWAIDFFTVETLFLKTVYVFAAIDIHSRQLVELRCCTTPLQSWTRNALLQRFGFDDAPDLIIRDSDSNYGKLNSIGNVKVITSPPGCPWFNTYVERFIGSAQRECTDHFLYFSSEQIQKTLNEYKEYYNHHRPHQSLDQHCPFKARNKETEAKLHEKIHATEVLGGLHHHYSFVG